MIEHKIKVIQSDFLSFSGVRMKIEISANGIKNTPYDSSVVAKNTFADNKIEAMMISFSSLVSDLNLIANRINISGNANTSSS